MIVLTKNEERIYINDTPLSKGGEGEIHTINHAPSRFTNVCVKIYHFQKRTPRLYRKITYMVNNQPSNIRGDGFIIAWPLEVVYDSNKSFIGFVMPMAFANSQKLTFLTVPILSNKLGIEWHNIFERSNKVTSMKNRLALVHNISVAVYQLHVTSKYVLEDFKPDNVLITPKGNVTLVDMDSIQISEAGQMIFPGTAATPDYIPPEFYINGVGKDNNIPLQDSWDSFAMGVVFYELLLGLHPYVVTPKYPRNDDCNDISQNVADNLFPFGNNYYRIASYSPLHNNFKVLPASLQNLFIRTFSEVAYNRPTAEEWGNVSLQEYERAPIQHITPRPKHTRSEAIGYNTSKYNTLKNHTSQKQNNSIIIKKIIFMIILISIIIGALYINNIHKYFPGTYDNNDSLDSLYIEDYGYLDVEEPVDSVIYYEDLEYESMDSVIYHEDLEEAPVDTATSIYDYESIVKEPTAQINNITMEHNQNLSDGKGMIIHLKFDVQNMKGKKCKVVAYFYDNNGNALIDINGKYGTTGAESHVAVSKDIIPQYENSSFSDLSLCIPYTELHQTGTKPRTLKFKVTMWDISVKPHKEFYNVNSYQYIKYTPGTKITGPTAQIHSITMEHNQKLSDGKGMIIHLKFDVQNMKGKKCKVVAYFYDNNGNALIDINGKYGTTGVESHVAVSKDITPQYENSSFSDLSLCIPYTELHQTGTKPRTLKFKVTMWDISVKPHKEFYNVNSYQYIKYTPGNK